MGILDRVLNAMDGAFSPLSDEGAYQIVAKELAADQVDQGLWTKALAECAFNKDQAKAKYIKDRVAVLQRTATREAARARITSADANAYEHFRRQEYELAAIGFLERAKRANDPDAVSHLNWLLDNGRIKASTKAAIQQFVKR